MMKKQLLEFVMKRLGTKIDDVDDFLSHQDFDVLEHAIKDLHLYWGELKTIIAEVVT